MIRYRCTKPQCGREVHRDDYHPKLHCYCGAPVALDSKVTITVLVNGETRAVERFDTPSLIRIGRGRSGLLMRSPDLNLSPYLEGKKSISREHLSLYITDGERARVNLESSKSSMAVNRVTMRPGSRAEEIKLPLQITLNSSLSLHVEMA